MNGTENTASLLTVDTNFTNIRMLVTEEKTQVGDTIQRLFS